MDIILLVISNNNLRQLYHELLFSPSIEIVPSNDIGNALLLLALQSYSAMVLYVDDVNEDEVSAFLQLRKKQASLSRTRIVLLSSEQLLFTEFLTAQDVVIDMYKTSPGEVAEAITLSLR